MNGSRQSVGWLVLALLPAVAVVAAAFLFVPMYAAMYAPLADRLPAETHFLFGSYRWLYLIPAVSCAGGLVHVAPAESHRRGRLRFRDERACAALRVVGWVPARGHSCAHRQWQRWVLTQRWNA